MRAQMLLLSLILISIQDILAQPFDQNNYPAYQQTVIDKISKAYETQYVFPEKGLEAAKYLKNQFGLGAYDGFTDNQTYN